MAKLLVAHAIAVRWIDQDANGHVNNTTYFTYFEQARIVWLHAQKALNNTGVGEGGVIAQASCNFRRAIPYPETVEVRVYAGDVGRTSFTLLYEMLGTGEVKYADGQTVLVWVDRATGKPQPVPDFLRRALTE